jgi:hypothetical protein
VIYKRWRVYVFTLISLVLAGCATQAQRQFEQVQVQYQSALRTLGSCDPLDKSQALSRLKERFIMEADDVRVVEKLSLKAHVTEQEAKDLVDISILRKPCNKLAIEAFSNVHPAYVASLARIFSDADADLAKAINKDLTIGEVNQRTVHRMNAWQAEFTQIGHQIQSQLNHAHQNELLQRQNAAQAVQNWRISDSCQTLLLGPPPQIVGL